MATVKTLQVVGYKNSGKTTLISKWLKLLTEKGIRVSTIKHHGHKGPLEVPSVEADSIKFFNEGSASSLAVGGEMVQMHMHGELNFQQLLSVTALSDPEFILVEGFKQEHEPKVVIIREANDWVTLQKLTNIKLVLFYDPITIENTLAMNISDLDLLNKWLIDYIEGDR